MREAEQIQDTSLEVTLDLDGNISLQSFIIKLYLSSIWLGIVQHWLRSAEQKNTQQLKVCGVSATGNWMDQRQCWCWYGHGGADWSTQTDRVIVAKNVKSEQHPQQSSQWG